MTVDYLGLQPPPLDEGVIELETLDGRIVDLYNESWLRSVVLGPAGLAFNFITADGGKIEVRFDAVRGLTVDQPADWVVQEFRQIERLLIRSPGPWPEIEFNANGMKYEFDAASLTLVAPEGAGVQPLEVSFTDAETNSVLRVELPAELRTKLEQSTGRSARLSASDIATLEDAAIVGLQEPDVEGPVAGALKSLMEKINAD